MENHIATVDVVNKAFMEDGSLKSSVFYNVLGEDFVRIAFEAAHAADPETKLYYNGYNLEDPTWRQLRAARSVGGVKAALDALARAGVSEVTITELGVAGTAPTVIGL
ncbi:hypothetical protein DL767_004565 [Monosporascus sp. MG133]|nr:hypothetical protein DL767_004565 [Monosporascus sp. MG133]